MIINMTTIACRQKHYIHRTLDSLAQSDGAHLPVNLILGSLDTSHVERYAGVLNFVLWDEAAQAQERSGRMRHNCNVNAARALRYGDDEQCLCCEDDIVFKRKDWLAELMATVAEIPETEFVLNLGQGGPQSPGKRYAPFTRSYLCGSQAIFYPTLAVRRGAAEYIEQNMRAGMNDALIGKYAKQYFVLYNTAPKLVGHIGNTSSFTQPRPPDEESKQPARAPRSRMQINITTFAGRGRHYLGEMMDSLFASDWQGSEIPIHLIMGSEDESHVQDYAAHPSVHIVPWDEETQPVLRRNCTVNKIRALRYGEAQSTLICEDDILFSPTWLADLRRAAAELEGEQYILSLFAAVEKLERATVVRGKQCIKRYPNHALQGAQALFYPKPSLRRGAAAYLEHNLARACGDQLIGQYARTHAALYATKDLLVSHIGAVSCFENPRALESEDLQDNP
jgi:hypothetical protein